jgi:hypothetical protein
MPYEAKSVQLRLNGSVQGSLVQGFSACDLGGSGLYI